MPKKRKYLDKQMTKNIKLPNEEVKEILNNSYYEKAMQEADNLDVTINHVENLFTNETYYLAMKIVPLLERKVIYLAFVENAKLNDICRRLKLPKKQVICLRNNGLIHFKHNLNVLLKAEKLKNGDSNE